MSSGTDVWEHPDQRSCGKGMCCLQPDFVPDSRKSSLMPGVQTFFIIHFFGI